METIALYLNSMFRPFPDTPEVRRARSELAQMMEDKYRQLREAGVSESTAVGTVITEFGNLDELAEALDIDLTKLSQDSAPVATSTMPEAQRGMQFQVETLVLSDREIREFEETSKRSSRRIGLAVGTFVACAAPMLFMLPFVDDEVGGTIGTIVLLLLVALGIYWAVPANMTLDKYKSWKGKRIEMPIPTRDRLRQERERMRPRHARQVAGSIALILLGISTVIVTSLFDTPEMEYSVLGAGLLLLLCGVGVGILVATGVGNEKYERLFMEGEYSIKTDKEQRYDQIFGAFAGVYWLVTLIAYLLWSLIGNSWDISWLIWPIAGLLFAVISIIFSALKSPTSAQRN